VSRLLRSIAIVVVVLGLPAVAHAAASRLALAPGDPAPRLAGKTLEFERWHIEWNKSKATLVNFWATWCEPCKAEMPALQKLHADYADDGLQIVGVLMDPVKDDELRAFLAPFGLGYRIVRPDSRVNNDWGGIVVMPITFLVDPTGRIVRRYVGATPEQVAGLVRDVEAFLGGLALGTMVIPDKPSFVGDLEREKILAEKEKQKTAAEPSPSPSP
jgi:cytochrome c biogenesis protein CcmG, thiol:disulfide interchange protein DsbE